MTYLTMKGFNKTTPPYKTYTIVWNEVSDPSQFFVRYEDDAAGLTQGSTEFDKFFGYSAVRLNGSGQEVLEVTQSDSGGDGKLNISYLGSLTQENVMIKFPVRGIKMSKSGTQVTLSITDGIGRETEGYQYYAFQKTGDINANILTTVETKPLYIGAYLGKLSSSKLWSWSGQSPTANYSIGDYLTYAANNGTGYTIIGFYQRMLIDAYYMLKYGNPNSQSVVGQGKATGSSARSTGYNNSETNATSGNSSWCRLFGIEDRWGNLNEWTGGIFRSSGSVYTALHDFTASTSTSQSQYKDAGWTYDASSSNCLYSIIGDSKGMFVPYQATYNSSYNTYYCDFAYMSGTTLGIFGGAYGQTNSAGIFHTQLAYGNYGIETGGSRIMYL